MSGKELEVWDSIMQLDEARWWWVFEKFETCLQKEYRSKELWLNI